jgi:periplasmic protein TonB
MERLTRHNTDVVAAANRIALALLASLALHLVLISRIEVTAPPAGDFPRTLHARLLSPQPPATQPTRSTPVHTSPGTRQGPRSAAPVQATVSAPDVVVPTQAEVAPEAAIAPSLPIDPVYYAAREIDVYPMPFSELRPAWGQAGWVRLLVLIDEAGAVTQAEVVDADPLQVHDAAAVALLRSVQFAPARKQGRPVRSRIMLELGSEGSGS